MSNPRTVTRFVEQRVTIGQIAYEAHCDRAGIIREWSDLDNESRAEWEAAAAAVADAVEDTRADEPPVQRIEPKPVTVKIDASNLEASIAKVQAMIEDANRIKDQPAQPDPTRVLFNGLVVSLASLPVGSLLFVDNLGHFYALHPDGKRVLLSKSAQERIYPPVAPTRAELAAEELRRRKAEKNATPLPPSAFLGAEPFIPSDS